MDAARTLHSKILATISNGFDLDSILDVLADELLVHFELDGFLCNLVDENKTKLICQSIRLPEKFQEMENTYRKSLTFPLTTPDVAVSCLKSARMVRIITGEVSDLPESTMDRIERWEIRSSAYIPLITNGHCFGVINIFSQTDIIDADELESIQEQLNELAGLIYSALDVEYLRNKEKRINDIHDRNQRFMKKLVSVNSITSKRLIYPRIVQEVLDWLEFDFVLISVVNGKALEPQIAMTSNMERQLHVDQWFEYISENRYPLELSASAVSAAFLKDTHIYVKDATKITSLPMSARDKATIEMLGYPQTICHIPIKKGDENIGVLSLVGLAQVVDLDEELLSQIKAFCSLVGMAITNAEIYTQVTHSKQQTERALNALKRTQAELIETERGRVQALRIAKESAEATSRKKSSFLASMSHEIRTPINGIMGHTQILLNSKMSDKQCESAVAILQSSENLLNIINDILDLSKIEAGRMELEEGDFFLRDVINNVADMFAVKLSEKSLDLIVEIDPQVPEQMRGDSLRLGQVLINLVNNAIKFTHEGHIGIRIEKQESAGDLHLKFEVSDTGIGMSQETVDKLFREYTQAEASTAREYGGTGLGLCISKSIIEQMHGSIHVKSEVGLGSSFIFDVHARSIEHSKGYLPENALSGKTVLVVDDNLHRVEQFRSLIEYQGGKVMPVHNVSEVISTGKWFGADIVLIDLKAQPLEMWQACLCQTDRKKILPVVEITDEHSIEQLRSLHMDSMISKPVKPDMAVKILHAFLDPTTKVESKVETVEQRISEIELDGMRVLLADDVPINQTVVAGLLEPAGVDLHIVSDGKEAVDYLRNNSVDLVLMDVEMPEMDGLTATRYIRNTLGIGDLPIIALTANAMVEDQQKCAAAGMTDYLSKPIKQQDLFEKLSKFKPKEKKRVSVAVMPEQKPANEMDAVMGRLHGIDSLELEQAMRKMGHNKKLMLTIMQSFINDYSDAIERVITDLNQGESESARLLLHSVKGVLGTIGAVRFVEQIEKAEKLVKEGSFLPARQEAQDLLPQWKLLIARLDKALSGEVETPANIFELSDIILPMEEIFEGVINQGDVGHICHTIEDVKARVKDNNAFVSLLDTIESNIRRNDLYSARQKLFVLLRNINIEYQKQKENQDNDKVHRLERMMITTLQDI